MRKVCVITGTRAEYGIMSRLMRLIDNDSELQLQIIATNMHLSPEFGLTYKEIENDGFRIDKKVEMLLSSDTQGGTVKSMGLELIGLADALDELRPDIIVILGDRYEMLCAAEAALIYRIPVAHLYGGEITEGAYDDAIRHAITKLSHLHFTSTEEYRRRVIQMGEMPERVKYVGALGVDNIVNEEVMPVAELEKSLGFCLEDKFMIVTFHPVTMENATAGEQCGYLLDALQKYTDEYRIVFTLPNSDTDGRVIVTLIQDFVKRNAGSCIAVPSLGRKRYYAALKYAAAVIGNSSSGLVEAPSFHIPTLNIGDRQKGRTRGASVVDVKATKQDIARGLEKVLSSEMKSVALTCGNPYYRPDTLNSIFEVLKSCRLDGLINKSFYNIEQ